MNKIRLAILTLSLLIIAGGCATVPEKKESRTVLGSQVQEAITIFKSKDPSIKTFFEDSYGYAVIPKIFKGAFWIGGAYGNGEVFEKDAMVGYCSMSQATLGFSFGGEFFREIIFFRDKEDVDKFKYGNFAFAAQASGIILSSGAAAKVDYKDGMAVFVMTDFGLMIDASLGGQKFKYVSKELVE
jgi:lipid-binding SYLF domain-containing protein